MGIDPQSRMKTPDPDCTRSELHTPCPTGYGEWFGWAASMYAQGATQSRCPGSCQRLNVWSPPRKPIATGAP